MKTIPLTRGLVALVDDEDYDRLSAYRWQAAGGDGTRVYARRVDPHHAGGRIYMHREVLGAKGCFVVDHIDGNTLDNRRSNLRVCTQRDNAKNVSARHTLKGIRRTPEGRWAARITVDYREIHLGHFDNPAAAARAYDSAAMERFGAFARLNFPNEVNPELSGGNR